MDVHSYMADLMATGDKGGTGRPVGRPKGPEKEKLPAIHVRDLPPSLKDALSALVEVFSLGQDEDGLMLRSPYGNQGQAVKTLMVYGMAHVAPYMAAELERQRKAGEMHAAIVRRFLDDMGRTFVTETDFPEGSAAHEELLSQRRDFEADSNHDFDWTTYGLSREEAFREAESAHWSFTRLERACRAVEAVLAEHRGNRQKL